MRCSFKTIVSYDLNLTADLSVNSDAQKKVKLSQGQPTCWFNFLIKNMFALDGPSCPINTTA